MLARLRNIKKSPLVNIKRNSRTPNGVQIEKKEKRNSRTPNDVQIEKKKKKEIHERPMAYKSKKRKKEFTNAQWRTNRKKKKNKIHEGARTIDEPTMEDRQRTFGCATATHLKRSQRL